jgi:hypothetical protein
VAKAAAVAVAKGDKDAPQRHLICEAKKKYPRCSTRPAALASEESPEFTTTYLIFETYWS